MTVTVPVMRSVMRPATSSPMKGGIRPPSGFVFAVDYDGAYLIDFDGSYLLEVA